MNEDDNVFLDKLAELYEQYGNLYHLRNDKVRSEIFYGVMVLIKRQKFAPEEIDTELLAVYKEINRLRGQT